MTSKRGRPKGDGRNDDRVLKAIALKLAANEARTYDEAAAALYEAYKPRVAHVPKNEKNRWRRKWVKREDRLMAEAHASLVRQPNTPMSRFMPTREAILEQFRKEKPLERFQTALTQAGLTMDQFSAKQAEITAALRNPLLRDAFARISSGEVHSALALARKFQS